MWKIGIVAVIIGFVLFGNRGIIQRVNLEIEKQQMTEQIKEAEAETERLREKLERVERDDAFIEKIARERYGMIRSGETVYRIAEE